MGVLQNNLVLSTELIHIINSVDKTKLFSQRITGIADGFAAMTSFKKTRELLVGSYLADIISDEEFVLLYD